MITPDPKPVCCQLYIDQASVAVDWIFSSGLPGSYL